MTKDLGTTLSPKVVAGSAGAGAGAIVTTATVWALGAGAFGAGWDAANVEAAMAAVPAPLVALVALVLGVGLTFIPAWWIRDHVREEGAAAIAAQPEASGTKPVGVGTEDASLVATAHKVQEVLDQHLANGGATALTDHGAPEAGAVIPEGLDDYRPAPDYVTENTEEDPPARGL